MKHLGLAAYAVAAMLVFTGCGFNNNQGNTTSQGEQTGSPEATENVTAATNDPKTTNQPSNQSVISEHYLSLGSLDQAVEVEGKNRDRDEVEIDNGKIVFPRGKVLTLVVKDDTKAERFVNASQKDVKSLLSAIEKAGCSTEVTTQKENGREVVLVYQTSDRDLRTVFIQNVGKNEYLLRVKEDDRDEFAEIEDISERNSDKDYDVVQFESKEVSKLLQKWID